MFTEVEFAIISLLLSMSRDTMNILSRKNRSILEGLNSWRIKTTWMWHRLCWLKELYLKELFRHIFGFKSSRKYRRNVSSVQSGHYACKGLTRCLNYCLILHTPYICAINPLEVEDCSNNVFYYSWLSTS